MIRRRGAFAAAIAACCIALCGAAASAAPLDDAYPSRPIHIMVPDGAGGSVDLVTREIAARLQTGLGQPVIVENRAGAGGAIGAEIARAAAPDGYYLLASSSATNTIVPHVQSTARYDGVRDFEPIANIAWTTKVLVVNPALPVHTLREFIDYAKARPGVLNYASTGAGSSAQLDNEMFCALAGVRVVEIPYRTVGEQTAAVMANHVQVNINSIKQTLGAVREGSLRALAVISSKRSPLMPDVPTMAEAGLPGYDFRTWSGLSAPLHTPAPVIAKLNAAVNKALEDPLLRTWLRDRGLVPIGGSAEAFRATLVDDDAHWKREVERLGIHP
ncbi:MAG: tripartite tricarboxylate transporter substrate-binding protein [Casimicrobiaceae bacterium]